MVPSKKFPSLADLISADPVSNSSSNGNNNSADTKEYHFISRSCPEQLGQPASIGYGGNTIAIAVHAAHQTLPHSTTAGDDSPVFHLYSVLGAFHGGAKIDRKLHMTVTCTRDTRSFISRRVVAGQKQDDGTNRTCAELTLDFHIDEPSYVKWSPAPDIPSVLSDGPIHPTNILTPEQVSQRLVKEGQLSQQTADAFSAIIAPSQHYVDWVNHREGVFTFYGTSMEPQMATPQRDLPIPQRTSYEWVRTTGRHTPALTSEPLRMAALGFIMDQAISYTPMHHAHLGFQEVTAATTLEFALRIFVADPQVGEWHLRERKGLVANMGRTYSEARLWSERGNLVCVMTQACILRGPVKKKKDGGDGEGSKKEMSKI